MVAKYICTAEGEIFVFSSTVSHSTFIDNDVTSAGFVRFMISDTGNIDCECFGESLSLNVKSKSSDNIIIKRFLFCETCLNCGNCEGKCKPITSVTTEE